MPQLPTATKVIVISPTNHMDFIKEKSDIILQFLALVFTSLVTYYATKKKEQRRDKSAEESSLRKDFDVLAKANADFRNEVRADLETAKRELEVAKKELQEAKNKIAALEAELVKRLEVTFHLQQRIYELEQQLKK
jgi:archaellum component FlaC